jgi:hypothetical protein
LYWRNFAKNKKSNIKIQKISNFRSFQLLEARGKNNKNLSDFNTWFSVCNQNTEERLKTCTTYLVYGQIWLNLPKDDHHFYYIFPWMIATLTHPFFSLLSSSLESKIQNSSDFEGFQLPQVRGNFF